MRAANITKPAVAIVALAMAWPAHASIFSGDTLDAVADVMAWIVLFIAPIIAIAVFLMVHILPEKVAEKRRHPQLSAIKTLCLLSLIFGGMLWPFAWLWAYSKPVLYKIAYGTEEAPQETLGHAEATDRSAEDLTLQREYTEPRNLQNKER